MSTMCEGHVTMVIGDFCTEFGDSFNKQTERFVSTLSLNLQEALIGS